jgi:hypothetical protein
LIFLERQRRLLRAMVRLLLVPFRGLRSALRSHADLMLENLARRQELAAFAHSGRRPRIRATDRLLWIALRRLWSRWTEVLLFVNPRRSSAGIERASGSTGRGSLVDAGDLGGHR